MELIVILVPVAMLVLAVPLLALVISKWFVRVPAGKALLVRPHSGPARVSLTGQLVLPFVATAELVDLTTKRILVTRHGRIAPRCRDNIRVNVTAHFMIGVNPVAEDVLKAAQAMGAARIVEEGALSEVFEGRFTSALATVVATFHYDELAQHREEMTDRILQVVGTDLDGFTLKDVAIVSIEQLPLEEHDPKDVLDAEAIRVISERTAEKALRTKEINLVAKTQQAKRELEVAEHLALLERETTAMKERHDRQLEAQRAKAELEVAVERETAQRAVDERKASLERDVAALQHKLDAQLKKGG
ncbi:MAG: hypothetical protein IPG04_05265 [Polyangiaceae bacterium]|nr:hypothetical protein [Polyangiaceae bacterium]